MTFFSVLYECEEDGKHTKQKNNWMAWAKSSKRDKERVFEYIGTHMVEVKSDRDEDERQYPIFYEDLNLNQIMEKIYDEKLYPQLDELYTTLISDEKIIYYRQDIMKDLEKEKVYKYFIAFQNTMQEVERKVKESQSKKYKVQGDMIYLEAMAEYCEGILALNKFYSEENIYSKGLKRLYEVLNDYIKEEYFMGLNQQLKKIKMDLEAIHYQLVLGENKVCVRVRNSEKNKSKGEAEDYSKRLKLALGILEDEETDYETNGLSLFSGEELNPLEIEIVEVLKKYNGEIFEKCHSLAKENKNFMAPFVERLKRELPFYINFIVYMRNFKANGYNFTYPILTKAEGTDIKGIYDLSLAQKKGQQVIRNNFKIYQEERGCCITGANQGGKTTILRSLGQVAYLTALGLPIPASFAKLPLYEQLYTHFSKAEDAKTDQGKLKEELLHLKEVTITANNRTLVLMNELFSSTTTHDAFEMSRHIIKRLEEIGCTIFLVTHVTALAKENLGLVSMIAEVSTDREGKRTYKIIRKEADGLAYTQSLVEKYGLSYKCIKERIGDEN